MNDITKELNEIGKIIAQARLIDAIKTEVHAAMGDKRASVTGGEMADAPQFDVVVRHKAGAEASGEIGVVTAEDRHELTAGLPGGPGAANRILELGKQGADLLDERALAAEVDGAVPAGLTET